MEIIFHTHHAVVSERMRKRAEAAVRRTALRLSRAVDAIIRFEQDGPVKRVEIVLHSPRQRDLVARGEGKFFGPAFADAMEKLTNQVRRLRSSKRTARRAPASRKAAVV
ncbi:MAG TPA: HPF/RaiA family ribosome-associated protein [Gemmatimonadaceae bacterium]|nr:HPF/RaiA family ribosome-associated protein [Gemmatimonadaceae bacterium]